MIIRCHGFDSPAACASWCDASGWVLIEESLEQRPNGLWSALAMDPLTAITDIAVRANELLRASQALVGDAA